MAHYYGTLQGHRGRASRLGTANSGLSVEAASWQGKVSIRLYQHEGKDGKPEDWAMVRLEPHHGQGTCRDLYDGPVSGAPIPKAKKRR